MRKRSHKPVRTCLGCRQRDHKVNLVRIASGNDCVTVDYSARLKGRGGYLHAKPDCIESFVKVKTPRFRSLNRALDRGIRLQLGEMIGSRLASKPTVD